MSHDSHHDTGDRSSGVYLRKRIELCAGAGRILKGIHGAVVDGIESRSTVQVTAA